MAPGFHDRTLRMLGETAGAAVNLPLEPTWQERDVRFPGRSWNGQPAAARPSWTGIWESQSNYDKAVALGLGDDPPVFFRWLGRAPWIVHCLQFSDSVFAHVFDYQYAYDNLPWSSRPYEVERYTGEVLLRDASSGLTCCGSGTRRP